MRSPRRTDATLTAMAKPSAPEVTSNEAEVGLPALLERRRDVYAYYRLQFLDDGYPGRRTESGLHAHPIYGTYVIADYLAQFTKSRDAQFLSAAKRVADAAINRMEPHEGGLAFWYEPADGISSLPVRFYSALTQARYLQVLAKLHSATGDDRYRAAGRDIFRSLLVPVEQGGVLRVHNPGVMIEEYAHTYPDYTLNGWTTAILLIEEYGRVMSEPEAASFFEQNVDALRDVLPLYDVPELANSRYRLTGPAAIRIAFDAPGAVIEASRVVIPRHGDYPIHGADAGRWQNRFRSGLDESGVVQAEQVQTELYLSLISSPAPNSVVLKLRTPRNIGVRMSIGQGRYRPKSSYLAARSYAEFASFRLGPGAHEIEGEIPWSIAPLIAYPTTFAKTIAGRGYNQYHFIHIANLEKLFDLTGEESFREFAERWSSYPAMWPEIPEYAAADIALERYAPASQASP